jgi:O-antigen ligase
LGNQEPPGIPESKRIRERQRSAIAVSQRPLISAKTLVTVVGVFVIPVTAGVMLLFYDAALVAVITVALYASLWLLFNPFPALLLYVVLVAVRPQEGIAQLEIIHVERLCAVLAMLGWGLQAAIGKKVRPVSYGVTGWFLAFVVVCFLSIFTSVWKMAALTAWTELLKLGVLFFLVSQLVDTPRRLFVFLFVFAVGHIWMGSESLRLYFSEGYDYVRMDVLRATTTSVSRGDPNSLAASLLLAACLGVYTLRSHRNLLWRICWLATIGVTCVLVVISGSRAAMVAVLFFLFYLWATGRSKVPLGLVLVLVVIVGWFAMPSQYQDRFMTAFDFERNPSATESARGRVRGLRAGAEMFLDRPLLGVGIGNFSTARGMIYSPVDNPSWFRSHNLLAQVGGETGILGVITFGGFVIACMREAARVRRRLRSADAREARIVIAVSSAALAICWILLFLGIFGHNLMRYNWYLTAGLISACAGLAGPLAEKTSHATVTSDPRSQVES